ncbi:MAG TPA: spermidine/putrescine ABC transporter substrate-binding protein [Candidatus Limnocylindrales bacterium]|nr:spermidine/putrescine ABC transporter substrate-binding protein [Candidatus Limnocylindrales bacterium]
MTGDSRTPGRETPFDLALGKRLTEAQWTRREFMARVAAFGLTAALTQLLVACGQAGASPSAAPATATPAPAGTIAAVATPTAAPTPIPDPEPELNVYNWLDYIGDGVIESFEEKYPVKVNYELFDDIYAAYEKLGDDGNGYDVSFPIGVDVPSFREAGTLLKLDQSLIPNLANLGPEWSNPGYDPGNQYSVPYVWWTTGIGYDTTRLEEVPTSSNVLWDPRYRNHISLMDDYQETMGLTLIQKGFSANTTDPAELDQAIARLTEGKPIVRTWTNDTISAMTGGDIWVGMIWGSDLYQISLENENIAYFIPQEGGVRGSDTMAIYSGAEHPIAAHLFINHMLDAQVSAANTNFIGYMGPNLAAQEFIDEAILNDPAVNPDKAILDKLEELLDLPNDVDKLYLDRWQAYRAG